MTLLAFLLILLACGVMVYVHFRTQKRLAQAVLDRQVALDKQAKVFVRELARSKNAADKTIDQARAAVDEARTLNQQAQEFFRDHRVQRFLNRSDS